MSCVCSVCVCMSGVCRVCLFVCMSGVYGVCVHMYVEVKGLCQLSSTATIQLIC